MKIGIVWEHGVSKWSMAPFEGLAERHDVTVFVGKKNKYEISDITLKIQRLSKLGEIAAALRNFSVAKAYVLSPYKRFYFYLGQLSKYINNEFDIIICHDASRSLNTLAHIKRKRRFKLVVSYLENIPFRSIYDEKTNLIKTSSWEYIDLLVPWCQTIKQSLVEEKVENPVCVIPMGVSKDIFFPRIKDRLLCESYGVDPKVFTFSYIGKLVSWKGVQYILYAANVLLIQGIRDFQITISGRGAQAGYLKKIINNAGLLHHVKFTGFLPYLEISRLYSITDCLILPSVPTLTWQEQFGMVLVEAMACKKPILAANSGSIAEVAGEASLLHTPGNWHELARDMRAIMTDTALRERLSGQGYAKACREFDASLIAKRYERALLNLL